MPVSSINGIRQRAAGLVGLARGLPGYLHRPLTLKRAVDALRTRLKNRDEVFLHLAEHAIYGYEPSIYRRLLQNAGCELGDLRAGVRRDGLENTLTRLRDQGVYLTLEEFKGLAPVRRGSMTIETNADSFANPLLTRTQVKASSSGSGGNPGTVVGYTWGLFEEEAEEERVLFATHGLENAKLAFWLPGPPGIAGLHNLLINLKSGPAPRRWFSHVSTRSASLRDQLALEYLKCCVRVTANLPAVHPRHTPMEDARVVARWMRKRPDDSRPRVLKAFASSAVRVVQAAMDEGIDLSGQVIFTGGEALTPARYRFLTSSGARVFARYVATEAGLIAAGCGCGAGGDEMHAYLDRLAFVQMSRPTKFGGTIVETFLITSLSANTPRILLNTELGDFGRLTQRPCDCLFGQLGMNTFLSDVRSHDKLTGEGMTLLGSDLAETIHALVQEFGGAPDDFQFWEAADDSAISRVVIAVSPRVRNFDEHRFRVRLLESLRAKGAGGALASQMWEQAQTLQIVRADPEASKGHKILPIIQRRPT